MTKLKVLIKIRNISFNTIKKKHKNNYEIRSSYSVSL